MVRFNTEKYCGHWYSQVRDFLRQNPDAVHKHEDSAIWDFIEYKTGIPIDRKLREMDMPRIRRALQELRNFYYPKTASFFERQKKAQELGGRYQQIKSPQEISQKTEQNP